MPPTPPEPQVSGDAGIESVSVELVSSWDNTEEPSCPGGSMGRSRTYKVSVVAKDGYRIVRVSGEVRKRWRQYDGGCGTPLDTDEHVDIVEDLSKNYSSINECVASYGFTRQTQSGEDYCCPTILDEDDNVSYGAMYKTYEYCEYYTGIVVSTERNPEVVVYINKEVSPEGKGQIESQDSVSCVAGLSAQMELTAKPKPGWKVNYWFSGADTTIEWSRDNPKKATLTVYAGSCERGSKNAVVKLYLSMVTGGILRDATSGEILRGKDDLILRGE